MNSLAAEPDRRSSAIECTTIGRFDFIFTMNARVVIAALMYASIFKVALAMGMFVLWCPRLSE